MAQSDKKRVAILATDGFEQPELLEPKKFLDDHGVHTEVVSPKSGKIRAWDGKKEDWGVEVAVDRTLDQAKPDEYDMLVLPGGVMNPDYLRMNPKAVQFAKSFFDAGKPVAAICHGPWLLVEAGVVKNRTLTSWPSLQTDIRNAGGQWVDQQVVTDQGLVTSRKPDDIPAFNQKVLEELNEGVHQRQRRAS